MKVTMNGLDEMYESLFADLKTAFPNDIKQDITNIATYFKVIDELRSKNADIRPQFLRLPLDEELFIIDPNKRTIAVPTAFQQNGIAVQGDHTAEIVYFKIPRFFDMMDLGACEIRIQWQNSAGGQDASKAYNVEITEDEVIFGWILSNDIVGKPGQLTFSVRFYSASQSKELLYSFSTKNATCTIQSALALDNIASIEAEDLSDMIQKRPLYAGIINSASGVKPVIKTNLPDTADLEGGARVLAVEAYIPDGEQGTVTYVWTKDGMTIPQEESASYSATIAGSYQVKIGNTVENIGTRYVESNITYIPAAKQISITDGNMPEKAYSAPLDSARHTVLSVEVAGNDEKDTVTYQWYQVVDEGEDIALEGKTNSSFTPEVNSTASYYCKVLCSRNNTSTEATSTTSFLHRMPKTPQSVSVTQSTDGKMLIASVVHNSEVDERPDLYHYQWYTEDRGIISGATNKEYVPTIKGEQVYYCKVKEVVFADSASLKEESKGIDSNKITFTVQ